MPMVGGKKFPYTEKGKKDAKKAAVKKMASKKNYSGVKSQISSSSSY